MTETTGQRALTVRASSPDDEGRGVARLDEATLHALGVSPGDTVDVSGASSTPAKVWRAERQDWNAGIVRLDTSTRESAGIAVGDEVTVAAVGTTTASRVVLETTPDVDIDGTGESGGERASGQLLGRPVVAGDVVPLRVMPGEEPLTGTREDSVAVTVVETRPEEPVTIAEETDVVLRREP